jgi:hypothetical protein
MQETILAPRCLTAMRIPGSAGRPAPGRGAFAVEPSRVFGPRNAAGAINAPCPCGPGRTWAEHTRGQNPCEPQRRNASPAIYPARAGLAWELAPEAV